MNLGLLDPFDLEYPDLLSHSWELQAQEISAFAFNKWGSLLVIGTRNGSIVLFDMDTKAQAQEINVFHKEIIYLSWDRSGRWIAAVSEDARVALFDLKIAEIKLMEDLSKLFPRGIKALHFHPKFLRNGMVLCEGFEQEPAIVNLLETHYKPKVLEWNKLYTTKDSPAKRAREKKLKTKEEKITTAIFDKSGDFVIVGSSHGHLGVIAINFGNNSQSVSTGSFHSTKLASSSCVRNFTLSRNGSHLLITTSDKVLRYSDIIKEGQMLEVKQQGELQDIVNKPQWQCAQFSGNADFIAAATAGKSEHKIYIWNRTFGNLVSILSGPKEGIENILWHPTLPLIAVMSSGGKVQLWTKTPSENWSAYAPDFEELDRNVVYEEKEDEFDNMSKQNPGIDSNHELLTLDLITPLTSQTFSESETEEIQFLPCNIQADECPSSRKSTSPRKDKRDTLKSVRGSEQKKHKRVKIQSC